MRNFLEARVTPEVKIRAEAVADSELLSEAAWLKRLILREIRAIHPSPSGERRMAVGGRIRDQGRVVQGRKATASRCNAQQQQCDGRRARFISRS